MPKQTLKLSDVAALSLAGDHPRLIAAADHAHLGAVELGARRHSPVAATGRGAHAGDDGRDVGAVTDEVARIAGAGEILRGDMDSFTAAQDKSRWTSKPDASPVVLLHGAPNDKSTWDAVAPTLARRHRVYAVDLRGFGESDRPGTYSFELMRDDVAGLAEALDAPRYALVGHSMGATIAWLLAQRHPERISHLVAIDSAPPKDAVVIDAGPRPNLEPPFDWDALTAILAQLADPDPAWWAGMSAVTAKTLILAGGPTSHASQQLLHDAHAAVPGSHLVEIAVGHHIHRADPDRFLAKVLPFLAS